MIGADSGHGLDKQINGNRGGANDFMHGRGSQRIEDELESRLNRPLCRGEGNWKIKRRSTGTSP